MAGDLSSAESVSEKMVFLERGRSGGFRVQDLYHAVYLYYRFSMFTVALGITAMQAYTMRGLLTVAMLPAVATPALQ